MGKKNLNKIDPEERPGIVEVPVEGANEVGLPKYRELDPEEIRFYRGLIEGVLFLSEEPMTVSVLARTCQLDKTNIRILADSLVDDYAEREGGIQIREIGGGYQFITSEQYSRHMKEIFQDQKKQTLSRSTLETLSIITYKQPVTLPEIEEIRGVNSRTHITTLMSRNLIKQQGYRAVPGRPALYVTTRKFLHHFSMNSLTDLPVLEEVKELRFDEID